MLDSSNARHAIQRAAAARGDKIGAWYAEKRSAKTIARAELDRLRADARAGHIQRLCAYGLERLARGGIADTLTVVQELPRLRRRVDHRSRRERLVRP